MQAQQRYRERRKQKFQEMEQTLEQLSSQVQDMQAVQSTNAVLQVCLVRPILQRCSPMCVHNLLPAEIQIEKWNKMLGNSEPQQIHIAMKVKI